MIKLHSAAATALTEPARRPPHAAARRHEARSRTWPAARIAVHTDIASVERIWRAFEHDAECTVFQSYDYLSCWFHTAGARQGIRPAIVVLADSEGTQAILPLAVAGGRLFRRLTWLGQDLCDYPGPLIGPRIAGLEPGQFRALWREVCEHLQSLPRLRHHWIDLRKMPAAIGRFPNPFSALPSVLHASDAYVTHLGGDWSRFYRERRSGKARKQDRSKLARLETFGAVDLVSPGTPDDIGRTLAALFAQKSDAFSRRGISDLFGAAGNREFFVELATGTRTRGLVHVSALMAGPTPAALAFGLEFRRTYSLLLVSYDPSFARMSPGVIHLNRLIERAIGRGMRTFDFLVGEQRLKLEWSDERIPLSDHIAAATWRGHARALPARAFARAKRWIKQNPAVWTAFQRGRAAMARLGSSQR